MDSKLDSWFLKVLDKTLEHEGGYVNDPTDPGGETQFGISKRAYPKEDIKALTRERAAEIYYRDYWKAPRFDRLKNDELAAKLFDLGVNCGTGNAVRFLQGALTLLGLRTPADGAMGPQTAGYANSWRHQDALLMAVKYLAADRYVRLGKPRFLAGWLARLGE
ncbi:MAG: peptidoglycan-binding protein [Deltaproteobacteria bacterium]|nr:peptidoglycan-binding protein [Deltaproteobacteria bacterium]